MSRSYYVTQMSQEIKYMIVHNIFLPNYRRKVFECILKHLLPFFLIDFMYIVKLTTCQLLLCHTF